LELFLFILLLVLAGGAFYLVHQKKKQERRAFELSFLHILIPKKESDLDEKKEGAGQQTFKDKISVMEQFLSSMHDLGKDHYITLEYITVDGKVNFFMGVPTPLVELVEKQLTSYYPDAIVELVEEHNPFAEKSFEASCEFELKKSQVYPLKTYQELESDPLNNVVNSLSKLQKGEGAMVQILLKPEKDSKWQDEAKKKAENMYNDKDDSSGMSFGKFMKTLVTGKGAKQDDKPKEAKRLTPITEEVVKAIDSKSHKAGFDTIIRVVTTAGSSFEAKNLLSNIAGSFVQFSHPRMNGLKKVTKGSHESRLYKTLLRVFSRSAFQKHMVLATSEIASLFHLPHSKYNNLGAIKWQNFKIAPPPDNLPEEGILLGHTNYRGVRKEVRLGGEDRFRHFYIIGQTGTGKSQVLTTQIKQDIKNGNGICVMDPHGELAESILPFIPKERADDVIIFNPADTERPLGLNMLEAENDDEMAFVTEDVTNMMIGLFGPEIFGPRIQDYFRNGVLTLMSDPDGGALTDIVALFTNEDFQKAKRKHVKNAIVKSWWDNTYDSMADREKKEIIPYFAAKFGQFITNATVRNIIGQRKSSFDMFEAMNQRKIILVNLSKGLIGDLNANLLGMIIISKIQVAAMRRQKQAPEDRVPFYCYIDEFQNFVTDSIESILSEARKYKLGLILAHQYIDQLEKKGLGGETKLKGAIFGNVGNILSYKIGEIDAEFMAKVFAPVFSEQDISNQDTFKAIMKLSIGLQPSRPFSLTVQRSWLMEGYEKNPEVGEAIKQLARLKYGRQREFVDREIQFRIGA